MSQINMPKPTSTAAVRQPGDAASTAAAAAYTRPLSHKIFLGFLLVVVLLYGGLLGYHFTYPPQATGQNASILEQCRQFCLSKGLIPTGHIANDARAYLRAVEAPELHSPLYAILNDAEFKVEESQPHPLLGKPAPAFTLPDDTGKSRTLAELADGSPIVVIFYYGYGCSHCVAQLFAIDKELAYFRQLGAKVIAISADTPEFTTKQFKEYGRFHFPTLSDAKNRVAQKYGPYSPADETQQENLDHGTFVVDRDGKIIWAYQGPQPFLDNKSLLFLLAESQQLPTARTRKKSAPSPAASESAAPASTEVSEK